jgi:hypothetical protein
MSEAFASSARMVTIGSGGSWPFWQEIANWIGEIKYGIVLALVVALMVAAVMWGFGKITKNGAMQAIGGYAILVVLGAAILVGSAAGLITFFVGQKLA